MAITTTSINFKNAASSILNAVSSVLPVVCGVPESLLNSVSPRYVVTLVATLGSLTNRSGSSRNTTSNSFTVYGYLQDKITLNASADWQGLTQSMPSGIQEALRAGNTLGQAFLNRTTVTTLQTRRIWMGSSPISVTMKLKFEAFNDVEREVVLPCTLLQGLLLPRGGIGNTIGLIPPGPSPFNVNLKGESESERNENITLDVGGGFLKFPSVIVKDVQVTYENRMSENGPIGAEVVLVIETYQMLTREDLLEVINQPMISTTGGSFGQGSTSGSAEAGGNI
jgi:hypothetical protein